MRVTRSFICGFDLHLYNGLVPDTRVGSTFGHEFVGVVEEVGAQVQKLKVGDSVLVPFNIACGKCAFCKQELYGNCHESNPEATAAGGIFGYSHTAGGYNGGQAEYVRVPYADVSPTVIPPGMDPDDAVMLTDVVPTGYQAAEMGGIQPGDTVVIFGAGPIGFMAAKCSWLFGVGRVIVMDHVEYRLEFVRNYAQRMLLMGNHNFYTPFFQQLHRFGRHARIGDHVLNLVKVAYFSDATPPKFRAVGQDRHRLGRLDHLSVQAYLG